MTSHILLKSLGHFIGKVEFCYADQLLVFVEKPFVLKIMCDPIHGTYNYHTPVFSTTDFSWFFLVSLNPVSSLAAVKCRNVGGRFVCLGPSAYSYRSECLRSWFLYCPFEKQVILKRCLLFWHVTQHKISIQSSALKMRPIGCPETSVTTSQRCVTCQKNEGLIHTAAESSNRSVLKSVAQFGVK